MSGYFSAGYFPGGATPSWYTAPDNAGVSFLNKWVLNKLIESPTGTFKLYDNDNVTVLKTWAVDDVNKTRGKAV